jgi:predicted nucleic acid-binding protein
MTIQRNYHKCPTLARCGGVGIAQARAAGSGLHQIAAKLADIQIAGIAAAYRLDLATRNVGDFEGLGLTLIDPWRENG